jgi:aspartate aminotransferase
VGPHRAPPRRRGARRAPPRPPPPPLARGVADRFAAVGCDVPRPEGGFYVWPDFEPLRETLERQWNVTTSAQLARVLIDEFGIGVLPGAAFGCEPERLTLRVAVPGIYGDTDSERLAALVSPDPLRMPWIEASLERVAASLERLTSRF